MQTTVNAIARDSDTETTGSLGLRRGVFAALCLLSAAGLLALMFKTVAPGGIQPIDVLVLALFSLTVPYAVVGFWNAVIGFFLMRFSRNPLAFTCPSAAHIADDAPITSRTALLSCIRNEDVDVVFDRLAAMLGDLDKAGLNDRVDLFVLSDTNWSEVAADETEAMARLEARFGDRFRITYRRRLENPGFKAGNIRDFCARWGADYDFALVLDADSFMSASAMARLIRVMEADPKLGILQSLVVGLPSDSGFARIFQFGMRLGMRSHTMGGAWWQGGCGPYWGHNAVIRLAPFMADCHMPRVAGNGPLSGDVLSHDQVEAALMRRAGYEVRVIPLEDNSYEENPPTLAEFARRDLRWCAGNLQYVYLYGIKGLHPLSRVQLMLATNMFLGAAAWMGMVAVFTAGVFLPAGVGVMFDPFWGMTLFAAVMSLMFAPKLASVISVLAKPHERRQFGGPVRFMGAVLGEVIFFTILAPIAAFTVALFVVQLPFGKRMSWSAQRRATHGLPLGLAIRRFWPHTVSGVLLLIALWPLPLTVKLMAIPLLLGLCGAIPFAVLTAAPAFGRFLARRQLFAIPEDRDPPAALRMIHLPALALQETTTGRELPVGADGGARTAADPAKS